MKRSVCLWALLLVYTMVSAQTQYGFVRSKGRMVNGDYIPGGGLQGASVFIKKLTPIVVISDDGLFSFPVPKDLKYHIYSVERKDYELLDASNLSPRTYSGDTVFLVMVKPDQQKADLLEKERNYRRSSEFKLQKLEDSIQRLNIGLEEKNRLLEEVNEKRVLNEKYIKELAEYYAKLDYDRISEFQRQVDTYLEKGEVEKARQLLFTKGSVEDRLKEIWLEERAEAQEDSVIQIKKENNNNAKLGTLSKKQELEQNCYSLFHSYLLEQRYDSASYYIEFRANMDSTNAKWQKDAAYYFGDQMIFDKAEHYYMRALDCYCDFYEENQFKIGLIKNNLALMYQTRKLKENDEALLNISIGLLNEAKDIFSGVDSVYVESGVDITKEEGLIITHINLFSVYCQIDSLKSQADSLCRLVVERIENSQSEMFQGSEPLFLSMFGVMLNSVQQNMEYEKLTEIAIETARQMALNDTSNYGLLAGTLYASAMQSFQDNPERAESLMKEALNYIRLVEYDNEKEKESTIANATQFLGLICLQNGNYIESERWYNEALPFYRRYAEANPFKYTDGLYGILIGLGEINRKNRLYSESESLYQEALNLDLKKAFPDSVEYDYRVADLQYDIGMLKIMQSQPLEEVFPYFNNAAEKYRCLIHDNPKEYAVKLANSLNYLGLSNLYFERFEEGETAFNEAVEVCHRNSKDGLSECDLILALALNNLGDLYSYLDRLDESKAAYDEAIEIYRQLYQNQLDMDTSIIQMLPELKEKYVEALGQQSFLVIYFGEFASAEQHAEMALSIDPGQQWIFSSLAASKLFQGKYDEAEEIYRNMILGLNDGMRNRFIEDLDDFEAAGVVPEGRKSDVERIRKILSE